MLEVNEGQAGRIGHGEID